MKRRPGSRWPLLLLSAVGHLSLAEKCITLLDANGHANMRKVIPPGQGISQLMVRTVDLPPLDGGGGVSGALTSQPPTIPLPSRWDAQRPSSMAWACVEPTSCRTWTQVP